MSTAVTTEDLTPATSINSLPREIKTLIVNLAKLQDESYRERQDSKYEEIYELTEGVLEENEWRGRSLNALFEVNKEWSELAAIHIFEIITRDHRLSTSVFKLIVFPRRVQFFRQIHLFGKGYVSDRLSVCLLSPTINSFYLNSDDINGMDTLFGDLISPGISGTIEQNLQWGSFTGLKLKITKIRLENMSLIQALAILDALPALTEIDLEVIGGGEEVMNKLGVQLAQYSSLKELSLPFYEVSIPDSWIDLEWKSASSLRSLSLAASITEDTIPFNQTDLDFISKFSSSLERLVLVNVYISPDSSPLLPSITFPKLSFLDITCDDKDLPHFLEVFSGSPIVSLQYATLENLSQPSYLNESLLVDKALANYMTDHPILQYFELVDRFLQPQALSEVEKLAATRPIIIKYTSRAHNTFRGTAWIATDQDHFDYCRPVLNEAFDHGKRRLVELEKENNVEG